MPATSEARIKANQANALKSTGPKTAEGKARSRANSLKHGMTGAGIVLAGRDASEVEARAAALMLELDPKSTLGQVLVGQIATLSVRMERGAKQEEEALASRVRHAADAFDHAREDQVEALFNAIADDPRAAVRQLRRTPEGVDRLIEAWLELRDVLTRGDVPYLWDDARHHSLAHLLGLRPSENRSTRVDDLSGAARGHVVLKDEAWAKLDSKAGRVWARDRLIERIDEEIQALVEHDETLDHEAVELDRLGAEDRVLFDASREASLARRYEAEARRGFFKALAEFRRAEAESDAQSAQTPAPEPESESAPLGSSCETTEPAPVEPQPSPIEPPLWPENRFDGSARGPDGHILAIGRAVKAPG